MQSCTAENTGCKRDGRAIEVSQLWAISFVFMAVFYVPYILRLELSLKAGTGPKSKARATEREKEEQLLIHINFLILQSQGTKIVLIWQSSRSSGWLKSHALETPPDRWL